MWRRGKSAGERTSERGALLLVPVLKEGVLPQDAGAPTADDDTEQTFEGPLVASAIERPVAEPPQVPEPTPAPLPAPAPAAPAADDQPPPDAPRGRRSVGRAVAFVVLLVALALVGLFVGRTIRDGGGDQQAAPTTAEAASTTARTRPAPAAPRGERWGPLRAVPAGRLVAPAVRSAAVASGASVVVLGGAAGNGVQVGAAGGVLRPVASLPSTRASAAAFTLDGVVYLVGGERPGEIPSDAVVRFDVASHRVTSAGTFVEPLAGAGYVQAGTSFFLVGGWTGEKYATAVLRFTPPGAAAVVARLPEALRDPAVALSGGKLYVAGGRSATGLANAVYVVDAASGTVSVLGRLPHPVSGAVLVTAGRSLYLLGGRGAAGPVAAVVSIDPASGKIEPAGSMPRPLAGAATMRAGATTYVLGGTRPTAVVRLGMPAGSSAG